VEGEILYQRGLRRYLYAGQKRVKDCVLKSPLQAQTKAVKVLI
jgi:hypothetical protein